MVIRQRYRQAMLVLVLLVSLCPVKATAQRRMNTHDQTVRANEDGGITIGRFHFAASYGRLIGHPDWYFYSPWHYWGASPFGYPFMNQSPSPDYPGGNQRIELQSGMGEIGLRSNVEFADVFIDGAYAGKVRDLTNIWLDPGTYDLEVAAEEYEPFKLRVFVLLGKILNIDAQLEPKGGGVK